jgi:hypothetical protein
MSSGFAQAVCAPLDDGVYMGSSESRVSIIELDVQELCDQCRALDHRRTELDQHIIAVPGSDQDREVLWQEQEAVLRQLHELIAQLPVIPATDPDGLRSKAGVLALLLRASAADPAAVDPQVMALALSVADDVARLT